MKNMDNVLSVRLSEEDMQIINHFAKETKVDKSTAVRELVEMGKIYFAINQYVQERVSIGKAAELANVPISEFMDLLDNLGIKNNLELEDYLEGKKLAIKLFK